MRLPPRAAPATRGPFQRPAVPVEVGDLEQQVAPGDPAASAQVAGGADAVDRVERPGLHQPLGHRPRHPGALPEVGQRGVRASRAATIRATSAAVIPLTSASDSRIPQPTPVGRQLPQHRHQRPPQRATPGVARSRVDPLDDVALLRGVDVEAEDRDPELPGVVEDQPLGVHARVVGEHAGQEVRRVVRLEPRRLVGRQRERGGVGLAEAERRERLEHLPDPLDQRPA